MDLVLSSGYARMPSNTTAQRIYEELALVALIDMDTGVVHNVEMHHGHWPGQGICQQSHHRL